MQITLNKWQFVEEFNKVRPEDYYLTTPLANGNVLTLGY